MIEKLREALVFFAPAIFALVSIISIIAIAFSECSSSPEDLIDQWQTIMAMQVELKDHHNEKYEAEIVKLINMDVDPKFEFMKLFMLRTVIAYDLAIELEDIHPETSAAIKDYMTTKLVLLSMVLENALKEQKK